MAGSENQEVPANEEEISGQEDAEEEESSEEEAPPAPQPAPKSKEKAKSKFVLVRFYVQLDYSGVILMYVNRFIVAARVHSGDR